MDKKNTMLLTVIAVATLLVAVVGATFAFFAVTGNDTTTGATVTSTTDEIGNVAIATTNAEMHIDTTAADFAESLATKEMWAKVGASAPVRSDYNDTETPITAFTLTATGASTVHYVCTVGVTATTTATARTTTNPATVVSLEADEYSVRLKSGAADTGLLNVVSPSTNMSISKTFTIHLNGGTTQTIDASAKLVNTTLNQSGHLSNASIQTALAVSSFTCTTEADAGTNSVN